MSQENYISFQVNRARYMPQNPFVVASKTGGNDVHVFYFPRHPSEPTNTEVCDSLSFESCCRYGQTLFDLYFPGQPTANPRWARQRWVWTVLECVQVPCFALIQRVTVEPCSEGLLLSGANDGKICLWDVQSLPKDHKKDDVVHILVVSETIDFVSPLSM